jgi:hypothetical protein
VKRWFVGRVNRVLGRWAPPAESPPLQPTLEGLATDEDPTAAHACRQRYERVCADMAKVWGVKTVLAATQQAAIERSELVLASGTAQELADLILEIAGPISPGTDLAYTQLAKGSGELARHALGALLLPMIGARVPGRGISPRAIMAEVAHWIECGHSSLIPRASGGDPSAQISDLLALQVEGRDVSGIRLAILAVTAAPLQAMVSLLERTAPSGDLPAQ